ncbi:PREDICTED: uncharacterized protein LOC105560100 isoform X2 [Vollenhovia emeryi]|uniref:uncharacterized protein LOC105560100 isoform X2 n=1 Tax=Vollenhovia emeryi TaxID=411798 RepID=UPI0005F50644|nr:PREDICTED: uncharacterized protein LOC105560100 isoform X2 [Vollenhovia emeryi]
MRTCLRSRIKIIVLFLPKLKRSVSKNDGSSLRSTKFLNNSEPLENEEETSTCEPSLDFSDVSALKSDGNNLRLNKKTDFLDRSTSTRSSLEDSQPSISCKSCGSIGSKSQNQVILNYMQELSAKIDWHWDFSNFA